MTRSIDHCPILIPADEPRRTEYRLCRAWLRTWSRCNPLAATGRFSEASLHHRRGQILLAAYRTAERINALTEAIR